MIIMAPATGKKRHLDDSAAKPKAKKTKVDDTEKHGKVHAEKPTQLPSSLIAEEVDFPRGGGTSFTPLEVKAIRAEAAKEAKDEIFQVSFVIPFPVGVVSIQYRIHKRSVSSVNENLKARLQRRSRGAVMLSVLSI